MSEWIEDWICAPPDIPPQHSIRIHQSSSPPGIYPMNMAEECAERLSNIVSLSRMRLANFGSEGKTTVHPGLFEEGIQALVFCR